MNIIYTPLKSTFSGLQFCSRHYGSIFIYLAVVASQNRVIVIWVALLLVGRSAFPWLLLSQTAWNSKESGAAAAAGVSTAICRYGVSAVLGRLMDSGGGSGGAASSGGKFQTARRGFVLIVLIFVFI